MSLAWMEHAVCREAPGLFFTDGESAEAGGLAMHICRSHCPVLSDCRLWANGQKWSATVIAGDRWVANHGVSRPAKNTVPTSKGCKLCERAR